jgi:NitT/TauT family transport system substrate-binding protein
MTIVLQGPLRGLFYAPFYACSALGAFARAGVDAKFVGEPSPGSAPDGLFAHTVDVSWGEPLHINQLSESRPDCDLACIGEAVTCDPFVTTRRHCPTPDP